MKVRTVEQLYSCLLDPNAIYHEYDELHPTGLDSEKLRWTDLELNTPVGVACESAIRQTAILAAMLDSHVSVQVPLRRALLVHIGILITG